MPAKTPAQLHLMRAVAHNPAFAKKVGIPQSVGREFSAPGFAGGGSIGPTPRSGGLGALADAASWLRDKLNAARLPAVLDPYGYSKDLLGSLTLGHAPEELNEWSYGNAPMQVPPMTNVPQFKPGRAESLMDTAFAAQPLTPLAIGAARRAPGALETLVRNALSPTERMPMIAQRGAVRLKGGNFDDKALADYLGDHLEVPTQDYFDLIGDPPTDMPQGPVQDWAAKQLRNYLRKDLGTPTDPLLQVEKEIPGMHLPEDGLPDISSVAHMYNNRRLAGYAPIPDNVPLPPWWDRAIPPGAADHYPNSAGLNRQRAHLDAHEALSNGAPLTPWGKVSDDTLMALTPGEYAASLAGMPGAPTREAFEQLDGLFETGNRFKWLQTAPPDTKIWSLRHNADDLGFRHVLDYLDAATEAHGLVGDPAIAEANRQLGPERIAPHMRRALGLHDAGLTLDPASLSRLSVSDAVRKTAAWKDFLANSGVVGDPDLARGIAAVHKEYPEAGMKWVRLGEPALEPATALPEGRSIQVHPKLKGEDGAPLYGEVGKDGVFTGLETSPDVALQTALKSHNAARAKDELSAGLNAEGNAMGHCVGGYCDDVAERGTQIYSLRDAKGQPHVTVEVRPGKDDGQKPSSIIQIKGKQNAAPVERYLPFVQDFVRSGQWGSVGDLRNTGLAKLSQPITIRHMGGDITIPAGFHTREEMKNLLAQKGVSDEEAQAMMELHFGGSRGYAEGGAVLADAAQARNALRDRARAALNPINQFRQRIQEALNG